MENNDCINCHRDDYEGATEPIHVQQLPLTCDGCHELDAWSPAEGSEHAEFFPLRFSHAETGCGSCHADGFESGTTSTACEDCHQSDYEDAARPPHTGLPTDCALCHVESRFSPATFVHGVVGFDLRGAHAQTACVACHGSNPPRYAGTSRTCNDCHAEEAELAYPLHAFETEDCRTCHQEEAFKPSRFSHPWELTGAHLAAECSQCHRGQAPDVYEEASADCVSCHEEDYENSDFPGHELFSTNCASCHGTVSW